MQNEAPFQSASPQEESGLSFSSGERGAPIKWPFLSMEVDEVIKISDRDSFASAKSAVMYAKKIKGYKLRTRTKGGSLFVKRFK